MGMFDKNEKNDKKVVVNTVNTEATKEKEPMQEEVKKQPAPQAQPVNEEIAIISPSTKIDGNLTTSGNILVGGTINGNVGCENIKVSGTVQGNISCASVMVECKNTASNIKATKNVIVKEGTTVVGDIHCQNITVIGTVEGNIIASGSVFLKATAKVTGDVTAATLGMECGAKINGQVSCK